ncbi:MAG: transporter substrate-binding domain-containing protein [Christensenellales bacterium]
MNHMKKLLATLLAITLLATLGLASAGTTDRLDSIKAAGQLVFATSPDYAPYEFQDKDGQVVGSDVELAKYIAAQLGVALVIEPMDFDTVIASVATGKVDLAVSGISPTDERKISMDFSRGYHSEGDQVLMILKANASLYKTLEDFDGKTVAAQNGSLQQSLVAEQLPNAKMEPIVKIPDGIMMVMTGKVEALAIAGNVATQYMSNYPDLTLCEAKFVYENDGEAVAIPLGSPKLVEAVNAIIEEVLASGKYLAWLDAAIQLNNSLNK